MSPNNLILLVCVGGSLFSLQKKKKKGSEARPTFAPQVRDRAGKKIPHPSRGVFYTEERNLRA